MSHRHSRTLFPCPIRDCKPLRKERRTKRTRMLESGSEQIRINKPHLTSSKMAGHGMSSSLSPSYSMLIVKYRLCQRESWPCNYIALLIFSQTDPAVDRWN